MSGDVVQAKTLQERVGDRIRDQIGDLMTNEDLKALVDKALQEAFFTRTPIPKAYNDYHSEQKYAPAFAVKFVHDLLKDRVDAACKEWLAAHADELGKHIDEAIGKGFLSFFQAWVDSKVQETMFKFAENLKSGMYGR
jgi:hypothetical protein